MSNPFRHEKISNWVSDFCESPEAGRVPAVVRPVAEQALTAFMTSACERRDVEPEDLGEEDVRSVYEAGLARLALSEPAHKAMPDLIAAFLSSLEAQGRLGGGRSLATYVRAHRRVYEEASRSVGAPYRREASKLVPNGPCPCGSGRKYKNCCKRLGRS